jgi:hypothetical protein
VPASNVINSLIGPRGKKNSQKMSKRERERKRERG